MSFKYKENEDKVFKYLILANDPLLSKRRKLFFKSESNFFKKNITGQKVLVAGSGLGHDSAKLSKYNKKVIGVEILKKLHNYSKKKFRFKNLKFINKDIKDLDYKDKYFDSAVLNMGTIGNFNDRYILEIIKVLIRLSKTLYINFYKKDKVSLKERYKMYLEEGWLIPKIKNNIFYTSDGYFSRSFSKDDFNKYIIKLNLRVKYYNLNKFTIMAKIY
jgi:ubiquinone/menaquinone biosynthesis C-methylase UbiE